MMWNGKNFEQRNQGDGHREARLQQSEKDVKREIRKRRTANVDLKHALMRHWDGLVGAEDLVYEW